MDPKSTKVLHIGTPKEVPLIFGKPPLYLKGSYFRSMIDGGLPTSNLCNVEAMKDFGVGIW